ENLDPVVHVAFPVNVLQVVAYCVGTDPEPAANLRSTHAGAGKNDDLTLTRGELAALLRNPCGQAGHAFVSEGYGRSHQFALADPCRGLMRHPRPLPALPTRIRRGRRRVGPPGSARIPPVARRSGARWRRCRRRPPVPAAARSPAARRREPSRVQLPDLVAYFGQALNDRLDAPRRSLHVTVGQLRDDRADVAVCLLEHLQLL